MPGANPGSGTAFRLDDDPIFDAGGFHGRRMTEAERTIPEEDIGLRQAALAYVIALYRELTEENGAPMPGTQNQVGGFHPGRPGAAAACRRVGRRRRDPGGNDGTAAAACRRTRSMSRSGR